MSIFFLRQPSLPLQIGEGTFALLQRIYCITVKVVLQNGITGSLFSKSVIEKSFQKVSLERPLSLCQQAKEDR